MKYIRTKDGRIGFVSSVREYNANMPVVFYAKVNGDIYANLELGDVQFADTIEELCDEFVCEKSLAKGFRFNGAISYFRTLKMISDIYGAIWTDKGLIYVAKMNDKGELELL